MNTLDAFLSWFASATVHGSLLALAVLAIQAALRGWLPAPCRYALWLPVVFVCLSPRLPQSRWSVENRFAARSIHVPPSTLPSPFLTTVPDELRSAEVSTENWHPRPRTDWRRVAAATWLAGVAGMLTCAFAAYARTMGRMRRGARPADAALVTMLADMALVAGLRRAPRLLVSTSVESPAVTGFLRPLLLLPTHFPGAFTREEARLVLLHEMIHLKRHDLPLNWLLCLLQAIHWCNPVLWFAFARMRADREAACDSQVLAVSSEDRRADYGHALLKLEAGLVRPGLSLGFLGIFERNVGMRSRIRAIAAYRQTHPAWGILAATLIVALTVVGATRAQSLGTTNFETSVGLGVTNLPNSPAQKSASSPVTPTTSTAFETRNTGVPLEVERVIEPGRYTIDLNLVPQVAEFEGFINYGSPIQTTSTNALGQQVVNVITPNVINQPIFSTRKVTSETVFDGQRVILGSLIREDLQKLEETSPVETPTVQSLTNELPTGTDKMMRKLNTIIFPRLEFYEATIREALDYLKRRSIEVDTIEPDAAKRGVNIVRQLETPSATAAAPSAPSPTNARLTISLSNISLFEALNYVTELAYLKFKVEPDAVLIVPWTAPRLVLVTKQWDLDESMQSALGLRAAIDAKEVLTAKGVTFPPNATASWKPDAQRLMMRNFQENLDLVDALLVQAKRPKASPLPTVQLKAQTITIPSLEFRETTLPEAVDRLMRMSISLDPDGNGINFVCKLEPPEVREKKITLSLTKTTLWDATRAVAEQVGMEVSASPYALFLQPISRTK